ncbi:MULTISPECIES: protein translocase subunit SecD [unclassified Lysobacter]|uniref:protein translocase subunit SecD n=1 Tax=unclassified Lysobacter TaxID=2635362 RepID=UPI0006F70A48|nr:MULTISPECIES: protein translocase subunit SecD [unclassified Lysobacter]KRA15433.1 preprotein translocase subunit SecD [Lysobacter sp. Root604]KRD30457.1 preprotein translocase subunit SecD [Lysobacter sp. Root916]KRD80319.1 preprotein translocase subunit SecD [Lysobacter sp. Root983]
MLTYSRWKYLAILVVLLLSALYALPNVFPQDPSVQISSARGAAVDEALRKRVADVLSKASVPAKSVAIEKEGTLLVRLTNNDSQNKVASLLRDPLGSDYVVALNLASTVPGWLEKIKAKPMQLGLDLQGGVHFLMQVDQKAALDKRLDATAEDVRVSLRDANVRYESVERRANNSIIATVGNAADADKARQIVAKGQPLLVQNVVGNTVEIQVPEAELARMQAEAVEQNVGTLRNRINSLGVAEPIIQRQGTDRIVVQLPGIQDTAQAKRILGATATLEYRGVVEGDAQEALRSGSVPPEARIYFRRETGPDGKPIPILLNKRVIASGDQLIGATAAFDSQSGTPAVQIRLNGVGGQRMFDYTTEHVGKPMAVVYIERIPEVRTVDGKEVRSTRISEEVINVATIQGVFSKEFNTNGLESQQEASDLALLLRAGSLAAPMDFIEERIVGPSLGAENVARGLKAVSFSFAFALIFFLIYYRMFGVITCLALLINLLMVVALMSLFGATMTLPGLAGIALTVGMSVDANVLINERIREELRAGLPPQAAIASGYEHASGTIIDANVTAFLAGLAMAVFGTGPLRGFGITLMLGIATSAYTAVSVSRGIATLIYGGRRKLKTIAI